MIRNKIRLSEFRKFSSITSLSKTMVNFKLNILPIRQFVETTNKNANENTLNTNQDKNEPNPVGLNQKMEDKKGTKHIYKQKGSEDEVEIIGTENTAYTEGYDDGVFVRQKMSFAYYEVVPKGSQSQSGGKSGDKKEKEKTVVDKPDQGDWEEKKKTAAEKLEKDKTVVEKPGQDKQGESEPKKEMPEGNKKI